MAQKTKFYCECCDISTVSQKQLDAHFNTEKHKKKFASLKKEDLDPIARINLFETDINNKLQSALTKIENLESKNTKLEEEVKKLQNENQKRNKLHSDMYSKLDEYTKQIKKFKDDLDKGLNPLIKIIEKNVEETKDD